VSNDAKLQKVILGPDWIDLSFGEPKVVMNALFRQLNRFGDPFKMPTLHDLPKWEYQPAAGKPDLVKILEEKYDAKVVVTNGAKQALAAAIFSFKRSGCQRLYFGKPYYPANPGIAESIGMLTSDQECECDSALLTSPNNPDGSYIKSADIIMSQTLKPTIMTVEWQRYSGGGPGQLLTSSWQRCNLYVEGEIKTCGNVPPSAREYTGDSKRKLTPTEQDQITRQQAQLARGGFYCFADRAEELVDALVRYRDDVVARMS
jgi:hypothetical protein